MRSLARRLARFFGGLVANRSPEQIWTKPSPGHFIADSDGQGGRVIAPNSEGR